MNQLFRQLNNQAGSINQIISAIKYAKNPQQMLMDLARQNPNIDNILNEINTSGQDPKALFYKKAAEMGVNPEDILKQLR